jgi:hypothetical protein
LKGGSPDDICKALLVDKDLKTAHTAVAHTGQTQCPDEDADVKFHFIAFIQHNKRLIELDGMKAGPICFFLSSLSFFLLFLFYSSWSV